MVNDAEAHAEEDKKQREKVDTKNQAESVVYQTEKQLQESGDKIPVDIKSKVESGIAKLKDAIKSDDTDQMKSALADLEKDMHAFAQELYKNAAPNAEAQQSAPQDFGGQQASGNGSQNPGADGEGPVFDAEFDKKD